MCPFVFWFFWRWFGDWLGPLLGLIPGPLLRQNGGRYCGSSTYVVYCSGWCARYWQADLRHSLTFRARPPLSRDAGDHLRERYYYTIPTQQPTDNWNDKAIFSSSSFQKWCSTKQGLRPCCRHFVSDPHSNLLNLYRRLKYVFLYALVR